MTRYLKKSKSLFTHIPRTGGTWINTAIGKAGIAYSLWTWNRRPDWVSKKHTIPMHYYFKYLPNVKFQWAIVRHPIAYYDSVYRYINQSESGRYWLQNHTSWHPQAAAAREWRPDFKDWIKVMLDNEPCYVSRLYELFVGPEGGEVCAFIGRTESLVDDFWEVMRLLGHEKELEAHREEILSVGKVQNKRSQGRGKTEWTDELKADVEEGEKLAMRRFYEGENYNKRRYAELEHPVPRKVRHRMYGKNKDGTDAMPPFDPSENPRFYELG